MNLRCQASLVSPLSLVLSVTENQKDVIVDSYLAILLDGTFFFFCFVFVFFFLKKKSFITVDGSNYEAPPFCCILSPPLRPPLYELETE